MDCKLTPMIDTRPEIELLLCFARARMDTKSAERIQELLRVDIDWAYLIRMSLEHGTMPLLYQHLNATRPEAVPEATLNQLREHFHANARHNLFLTGELLKLLDVFEENGIPVMPFKGPILAASVYGNLALRQFADLDILVCKRDVLRAKELLISQGYQRRPKYTDLQEAVEIQTRHHFQFVCDEDQVLVELHWGVTDRRFPFRFDFELLWEHTESVSLAGKPIPDMSSEDLLLVLCVHGFRHSWGVLGWICDVAELIRTRERMDWDRVMDLAQMLGSVRLLFLGLLLASDLLQVTLPQEVLQRVRADFVVKSLAVEVSERLFCEADKSPGNFAWCCFQLRARERLQDNMRFCFHLAMFPNMTDMLFLPLPSYLFFLYYPLRPIRLIGQYGLGWLRRFFD